MASIAAVAGEKSIPLQKIAEGKTTTRSRLGGDRPVKLPHTASETDKKTSFLDLLAELRNKIYELALVWSTKDKPLIITVRAWTPHGRRQLLSVFRQVRSEAQALYYARNYFVHGQTEVELNNWLAAIGSNAVRALRHLSVTSRCRNWASGPRAHVTFELQPAISTSPSTDSTREIVWRNREAGTSRECFCCRDGVVSAAGKRAHALAKTIVQLAGGKEIKVWMH